jgi:uncharacterized membrane protein YhaH (DUF805 family)
MKGEPMKLNQDKFIEYYSRKETEELLSIHGSGQLTSEAYDALESVLKSRGIEPAIRPAQVLEDKEKLAASIVDKQVFSFQGRINRKPYWIFLLVYVVGIFIAAFIDASATGQGTGVLFWIFILVILWPALAIQTKRWHDRNKSGLWILVNFIPVIGPIWALIENGFLAGTEGSNRFGENPIKDKKETSIKEYLHIIFFSLAAFILFDGINRFDKLRSGLYPEHGTFTLIEIAVGIIALIIGFTLFKKSRIKHKTTQPVATADRGPLGRSG